MPTAPLRGGSKGEGVEGGRQGHAGWSMREEPSRHALLALLARAHPTVPAKRAPPRQAGRRAGGRA